MTWAKDMVAEWRMEHYRLHPEERADSAYSYYLTERALLPERKARNRKDFEEEAMRLACQNVMKKHRKDRKWRSVHRKSIHDLRHPPHDPHDHVSAIADREIIDKALALLDERLQHIAKRHLVDGLTQREVATEIGVSHNRIYQLVNKAIKLLQATKLSGI